MAQVGAEAFRGLDAEGVRRRRGDDHVLDAAVLAEKAGLHGCTEGNRLVRVETAVGPCAEVVADEVDHRRHAGGAADQDHLVDLVPLDPGVPEDPAQRQPQRARM